MEKLHAADRPTQTVAARSAATAGAPATVSRVMYNTKRSANPRNIGVYLLITGGAYLTYALLTTAQAQAPFDSSARPFSTAKYRDIVRQMEQGSNTLGLQMRDDAYQNPHAARSQRGSRLAEPPNTDASPQMQ